jgi:hypothetical protein
MRSRYKAHSTKYWPVFSKMNTRGDALETLRNACFFFNVLVGAYVADAIKTERFFSVRGSDVPTGTFLLMGLHMAIFALGGFLLYRLRSRVLAIAMFCACAITIAEVTRWASQGHPKAIATFETLFLVFALWGSARAIEATFKLRGRFSEADTTHTK